VPFVTVFGGSRVAPESEQYSEGVRLGRALARAGLTVVTGGYQGTMAAASQGAKEGGGSTVGVTLESLSERISPNPWVDEEVRTAALLHRIDKLVELGEGFVVMPGGAGTMAELAVVWNLAIIGALHGKPIVVVGAGWEKVVRTMLAELHTVEADLDCLRFVAGPEEAASELTRGCWAEAELARCPLPARTLGPVSSPTLASAALSRTSDSPSRTVAKKTALVIGFSAFIALSAQISVPFWPVPFTGQTLAVLVTGTVLGPRLGMLAVVAYLAEAMAGLPVFSAGANAWTPTRMPGVPYILGTTGGYLAGFVLAAGVVGWLAERGWDRSRPLTLLAMLLGELAIYAVALPWLARFPLPIGVLDAGLYPFLVGDAVKIAVAAIALPGAWTLLGRRSQQP